MSLALSAERLREAREAAGLSRQQAAERVGCSLTAIQTAERGWVTRPDPNMIASLAAVYGVSIESLFLHTPDATAPEVKDATPAGSR